MEQYKNLERKVNLKKLKTYGLVFSSIMFLLNMYTLDITHSIFSEIGILISFIGLLYFSFDYKGY